MKRGGLVLLVVVPVFFAAAWAVLSRTPPAWEFAAAVGRAPRIWPDYSGTVVPANIAPLNFVIREEGSRFAVRIHSESGEAIEIVSRSPKIAIPWRPWKSLLDAHRGKQLWFDVYTESKGQWQRYERIGNRIAREDIDPYLVYRRINPVFSMYRRTAIYQRDLTTYKDSLVLDGMSLEQSCVNCHTFPGNNPFPALIGVRSSKFGNSALLVDDDGRVRKIGARLGYTAWHPSGRLVVYSIQEVDQFYHAVGTEVRDVIDWDAALGYLQLPGGNAKLVPGASDKQRLESYPAWSPDGEYLYYSSAPMLWKERTSVPARYADVKYDLIRIHYDLAKDAWGTPEVVLPASETGLSILQPRISPDGRFLLCSMCRYGCFPAYQPSSDLYMVDNATREYRRLDINSDLSESWHCWSQNGRWIAFSSKRQATPFTRCYLSFVDEMGKAYKPFILPQNDPEYYDSLLETISVPELIAGPITVPSATLERAARSSDSIVVEAITAPTKIVASDPWQSGGR